MFKSEINLKCYASTNNKFELLQRQLLFYYYYLANYT